MHIPWKRMTVALGVPLLLLAAVAPAAYASESSPASGTFDITITPNGSWVDDGNTIISFTLIETFTGTMTGTRTGSGTLVSHPDGSFSARTSGLFTGTIGGVSGSATFSDVARGVPPSVRGLAPSVMGKFRTFEGSGAFENIRVTGTIQGSATSAVNFTGTYTGLVRSTDE